MVDHDPVTGLYDVADDADPEAGERGPLPRRPRVLLPDESPPLPPAAAAVLLRILRRTTARQVQPVRDLDYPMVEEERRAA